MIIISIPIPPKCNPGITLYLILPFEVHTQGCLNPPKSLQCISESRQHSRWEDLSPQPGCSLAKHEGPIPFPLLSAPLTSTQPPELPSIRLLSHRSYWLSLVHFPKETKSQQTHLPLVQVPQLLFPLPPFTGASIKLPSAMHSPLGFCFQLKHSVMQLQWRIVCKLCCILLYSKPLTSRYSFRSLEVWKSMEIIAIKKYSNPFSTAEDENTTNSVLPLKESLCLMLQWMPGRKTKDWARICGSNCWHQGWQGIQTINLASLEENPSSLLMEMIEVDPQWPVF